MYSVCSVIKHCMNHRPTFPLKKSPVSPGSVCFSGAFQTGSSALVNEKVGKQKVWRHVHLSIWNRSFSISNKLSVGHSIFQSRCQISFSLTTIITSNCSKLPVTFSIACYRPMLYCSASGDTPLWHPALWPGLPPSFDRMTGGCLEFVIQLLLWSA